MPRSTRSFYTRAAGTFYARAAGTSRSHDRSPLRRWVQGYDRNRMFTAQQRDALRERVLLLAQEDDRVVAGAIVGSLAVGAGDRFSDIDLTFGIADGVRVADVLDDWTRTLVDGLDAVRLAELERGPTTYRVFLLPDALQLDLSMTSAARFRPAGPRFRLLFGKTAAGGFETPAPSVVGDLFSSHAGGRKGHIRVGRHLRAPHTCVHRARACLASGALRRRCPRPRALACLPSPGADGDAGARLRRPYR
jgi:hypothetical protein